MIEFRLKNALDFYNFFKMDLLKIPSVAFSENLDYNSEACILTYSEEQNRCFALKPDGSFSDVCSRDKNITNNSGLKKDF